MDFVSLTVKKNLYINKLTCVRILWVYTYTQQGHTHREMIDLLRYSTEKFKFCAHFSEEIIYLLTVDYFEKNYL